MTNYEINQIQMYLVSNFSNELLTTGKRAVNRMYSHAPRIASSMNKTEEEIKEIIKMFYGEPIPEEETVMIKIPECSE